MTSPVNEGRTVLVTGGSRGLGAGLVRSFLERGDRVVTCSRTPTAQTDRWSSEPAYRDRFLFEAVDLADREATEVFMRHVHERFGPVGVLVNNAGLAREGVIGLFADTDVDAVIDLNLKATIHVTRLAVRRMLVQGEGRIINISSIVGLSGYRGLSVYGATKAALDGFTRALARELGSRGITVNSVAPGYLRTEMSHGLDEAQLGQIARRTPAGRLGEPEDVATAVQFLASPEAAFISGHVLVVDGGLTA
jgi:3-oxoacyl-[acyl-carrier protein] reductase